MGVFSAVRRGACLALLVCGAAEARPVKRVALSAWEQAVAARESFEASGLRSKAGFARVMEGYRAIYHGNPADTHAAEAVNAVAELLAEQGRALNDPASLRAAVGQYEFLRTQYPASSLRAPALLAEGRIEADDLGEPGIARKKFSLLVKEAPRSAAASEARVELAGAKGGVGDPTHRDRAAMNGARRSIAPEEKTTADSSPVLSGETHLSHDGAAANMGHPVSVAAQNGRPLALVSGIRHWSTPTYTRVAIDLGDEVTFQAARVPAPDRLYFDLHGARLGTELIGKSFDVTDNGFLTRIRAAQAGGDVTRVVLDVNDVTDYSAFLLPNPYRLIIDIHGRKRSQETPATDQPAPEPPVAAAAVREASAAASRSGLPAMAPTDGGDAVRPVVAREQPHDNPASSAGVIMGHPGVPAPRTGVPTRSTAARPVPNAVAVKMPASETEVAAVSAAPGRVEATSAPTSKPVVAVVTPVRRGSAEPHPGRDDAAGKVPHPAAVVTANPAKAADRTAEGETSLIRALGLKVGRIVIDAGHGGHDSGTLGVDGIQEKDVVLDVALRLGKLLHERLGAEIIYTRSDDTFIPLETRTAIANKAQADLFLSIHANSSQDTTARGVETYYLNFTSDPTALDVAARENAVSGSGVHQLSDLVKKITLKDKIAESREFASDVEGSLYAGLEKGNGGLKNRGVKKAPFVVLIGANMPSILAEISFVTNARDASQLREPEYRQRVAASLFDGVAKYESGLAGAKPLPSVRAAVK